jgi:hypothetical protein
MYVSPTAEVVGLYSTKANETGFARFVSKYVDAVDPANFDAETLATLRRLGRNPVAMTEEERCEVAEEIEYHLASATYVEVVVRNADASFNAADFTQPDPAVDEGRYMAAWNETYLTDDGESVVSGYPSNEVPAGSTLRVVFVIHFWNPALPLASSYGSLECPPMTPLPERLWRLVPYETVD